MYHVIIEPYVIVMDQIVEKQQIEQIIRRTFRASVSWRAWDRVKVLPLNLRSGYDFQRVRFMGQESLLMIERGRVRRNPTRIARDLMNIQRRFRKEVIYVSSHLTYYQRQRLIAQGVPFIVPGRQLFLPDRALHLQERGVRPILEPTDFLPATQVVLLHMIYGTLDSLGTTPAVLAESLGYSRMTMTRAVNQLEGAGIIRTKAVGRNREVEIHLSAAEMWKQALPSLRSPRLRSRWILPEEGELPAHFEGGLTALAGYSDLAPPAQRTIVISESGWHKQLQPFESDTEPQDEADWLEVQVWSYDPGQFTTSHLVDPLSLYLSLRGTRDERVEEALDEMLGRVRW